MADFAPNAKVNSNNNNNHLGTLQDHLQGVGGAYTSRSRCEKTSLSRYFESRGAAVTSIGSMMSKESVQMGEVGGGSSAGQEVRVFML